jgi:GH18 family chitinase
MAGSDPMYRIATGVNGQYAGGSIAWKDIPSSWNLGKAVGFDQITNFLASASWDDGAKVPYIFDSANRQLLGFENPASIGYKGQYAAQKNIGGLMIWSLDQDDDQFSMLKAVAQGASGLHNSDVVNYTC